MRIKRPDDDGPPEKHRAARAIGGAIGKAIGLLLLTVGSGLLLAVAMTWARLAWRVSTYALEHLGAL